MTSWREKRIHGGHARSAELVDATGWDGPRWTWSLGGSSNSTNEWPEAAMHYPSPLGGEPRKPGVLRRSEEARKARYGELPGHGRPHCCLASNGKRCDLECPGLWLGSPRGPGRWHASRMVIIAPCPNGHQIIVQWTGDVNRGGVEQGSRMEMGADRTNLCRRATGCTSQGHTVWGLLPTARSCAIMGAKGRAPGCEGDDGSSWGRADVHLSWCHRGHRSTHAVRMIRFLPG
jgi:hypothetical protein